MTPHFSDRLTMAILARGNLLCAGLDPHWEWMPPSLRRGVRTREEAARAVLAFNRRLLSLLEERVPVVKLQSACYEALGIPGMETLAASLEAARKHGLLAIVDAKRSDIGASAVAYGQAYFTPIPLGSPPRIGPSAPWRADALTVNPYLGEEGLQPLVKEAVAAGGGLFVLVRTSNPSSDYLQGTPRERAPLYRKVAALVERLGREQRGDAGWSDLGMVVGGRHARILGELRRRHPHHYFLIPGLGAQGAPMAAIRQGFNRAGMGGVVNVSRTLTFAWLDKTWPRRGASDWETPFLAALDHYTKILSRENLSRS